MALDEKQIDRLQSLLTELGALSVETDEDGNGEMIDSLLELIEDILERYPGLQDDE
jgi:hypothetical protein